ncbi:hypothetical protein B0T14DRAFT_341887 [Immersiella caudata]|uniref:Uncharacterized protein n=1 Tax=Immersiella caudata TaxID=314043 RepID=A0AA39U6R0_9PEZI|nr:hypothetical protein B0T14DRAFT_341887 [Immersiella caudata]
MRTEHLHNDGYGEAVRALPATAVLLRFILETQQPRPGARTSRRDHRGPPTLGNHLRSMREATCVVISRFITLAATASANGGEVVSSRLEAPLGASKSMDWAGAPGRKSREALLSPRILHFASGQMQWACYCLKESEDGLNALKVVTLPESDGDKVMTSADSAGIFSLQATIRACETLMFRYPRGHDKHWNSTMQDCPQRRLTYQSDKVPALAGITQLFQDVKNDPPLLLNRRRATPTSFGSSLSTHAG